MPGRPIFILGVGAQRSGTSWFFNYLKSMENVDVGFLKEYHIWDALHVPVCEEQNVRLQQIIRGRRPHINLARRWIMQNFTSYYFWYFKSRIKNGVNMVCDITPSYSALGADALASLRSRLLASGFDIRVVFFMRDPFERCWSAVRGKKKKGHFEPSADSELLQQHFDTAAFAGRTRYDWTVRNLEAVFDPSEIYYGIYEVMCDRRYIDRLSAALGLTSNYAMAEKRLNVNEKQDDVEPDVKRKVIEYYSPVYEFCFDRFPVTRQVWNDPKEATLST